MPESQGLSHLAYEPLAEGQEYTPYVPASRSMPEFTLKAAIPGIIFGIIFGAANAYLGLEAGLTISTSIPVAVMTVAVFRLMRGFGGQGTLLEANMSQTIGSASSSVASGIIFTLPALFMWGIDPKLLQMTLLGLCGAVLGVLFMIPLRSYLIAREHGKLPYPEGTACAEVLVSSEIGGAQAKNVFWGLGAGALVRIIFGWLAPVPGKISVMLHSGIKAEVGMKMSSALFGVGFILGPRIATVMVAGGLLSSLIIVPAIAWWGADRTTPFFPETQQLISEMAASGMGSLWDRYVRYIGAGAVAAAGIMTLIRSIPTMIESFRIGARQIKQRVSDSDKAVPRTAQDLPLKYVLFGVAAVFAAMTLVPQIFSTMDSLLMRATAAALVVIFAFFFVTVASRIVGLVGVTSNPVSGMTIASLLATSLVFRFMGWTGEIGMVSALTVGCVVAIAASISGDTSQDLKTGFLLGATPRKQQIGELLGVLTSATFVCLTVLLLQAAYKDQGGLGGSALPAPQATLMKLVIEGVLKSELPWTLVGIGAAIAITAELFRVPSLPFAVGVYLPVATMVPVFLGGMMRLGVERFARDKKAKTEQRERGILFGSGLVGGEGLIGVAIAGAVFAQKVSAPPGAKTELPGFIGTTWAQTHGVPWLPQILSAMLFAALAYALLARCRARE